MQEDFHLQTLHRGRFIWGLLSGLFVIGYVLSLMPLSEIAKILILLFCVPVLMWGSVKFNRAESLWEFNDSNIRITKFGKTHEFSIQEVAYVKNHIRSGGNLLVFYFNEKSAPIRLWRNKMFVPPDQFDALLAKIKALDIEVLLG
ncbi:MAG: hypothetical protein ACTHYC_05290 [Sphingobacterium sp.]